MNREIKFRVWDSENMEHPKMQYCDEITVCDNGLFFEISKFDMAENHNDTNKPEIMQYTGSKDKNGEEIYEGDIVKLSNNFYPMFRPVIFSEYGSWDIGELGISFGQMKANGFVDCEIVGNIYENPELVTTSNSN